MFYVTFVCSVALVISGLAVISYEARSAREGFMRETSAIADIISQSCASAITFQDVEFATRTLAGLETENSIINACIYNLDNEIMATFCKDDPQFVFPPQEKFAEYDFPPGTLALTRPVMFGGVRVGTIFIQAHLDELTERIRVFIVGAVVIFILALILALVLGNRLIRTITQPVIELQRTASDISRQHNYEARAKKFSDDELGQLTSDFNHMLDQIQQKDSDLRQSEARFNALLGRIDEVIFRLAMPERTFEYCSPAALNMFGYSPDQLIEDPQLFSSIVHPESLAHLDSAYAMAAAGELAPEFEFRIIDRNDNEKWLVQTNSPVFDDDGNLKAIEGCCFNITDRVQAEKDRAKFKSELAQTHRLEALGTLTGGIAHDFNNMLAAIMGYACLVKDELTIGHPANGYIEPIMKASERAKALVRQILTFARQESPEQKAVSLADVISEALTLIRASLPSTINIRAQLPEDIGQVMADAGQIHQVIMNLCTNAFHAMRDSGGLLSLELKVVYLKETDKLPVGNYMQLSISDTGEGISEENLNHIFEPFFTTKEKAEGTGMGLSVVYGIVLEHGGTITVESTLGQGTVFNILLPRVQLAEQTEDGKVEELFVDSGRVLFVDDENLLVNMGCSMLEKMGYEVDGFDNPTLALEKFTEDPSHYDLVLSDFTMPNLTGMDLARKLNELRSDIPIILLTGHHDYLLSEDAARCGVVHIATKPISFRSLTSLVHRTLSDARQN